MKTNVHFLLTALLLVILSHTQAQTTYSVCSGSSATLVANNTQSLSGATYSLNPGGLTSSNPTFVVTPSVGTTYTLYVTGTNTVPAIVTNTQSINVVLHGVTFSVVSTQNFTLGCNTKSIIPIQIFNAASTPAPGAPLTYSFLAPGSSTILPANGPLGFLSSYSVTIPGTWSVVVRDNTNLCTSYTSVVVSSNTTAPLPGPITINHPTLSCFNPTAVLQVTNNPNYIYTWVSNSTPSTAIGNTFGVNVNGNAISFSVAASPTLFIQDIWNHCESSVSSIVYQNAFPPNAGIYGGSGVPACQPTVMLTNVSTTGIPPGTFPSTMAVVGLLWSGPAGQTQSLSSTHVAQSSGVYTLTAQDLNNGCTDTATISVNLGPVAAISHTVAAGTVTFVSNSTGTGTSSVYLWDFGDGYTSNAMNTIHAYASAGTYFVKLKIIQASCQDSIIQSVNVTGIPCLANSSFNMGPTATPQTWTVSPAGAGNILAAQWSWGDGSVSNTLYTSHSYSAAGLYQICLTVTATCGNTSSTCSTYSVYRGSQQSAMLQVNVIPPLSIPLGIDSYNPSDITNWQVYPVPANNELTIISEQWIHTDIEITITDITGRIVQMYTLRPETNSVSVSVGHLAEGMYLMNIHSGTFTSAKRILISH